MLTRKLFTFGTLYPDEMIKALLGEIPENFYGTLKGFSVYRGNWTQLPENIRKTFEEMNVDQSTFSYAFAKKDYRAEKVIKGRIYSISLDQELVLDHWERYPDWYRKLDVVVKDELGNEHDAFIYTLDIKGELMEKVERVLNTPEKALANAKKLNQRVADKFPSVFNK